ncbi:MAG: polysaccharide biosynthesis tyrosine autokinase [Bacteroidota bacterium]
MNTNLPDMPYDGSESAGTGFSIQEYLSTLLRGKWIILISFGVCVLVMLIYTLISRPVYESSSLVLVNMKQQLGSMSISESPRDISESKIANELAILKSRLLAEAVAQTLLENPYLDDQRKETLPVVRSAGQDGRQTLASVGAVAGRVRRAMDFAPERESDVIRIIARSADARESAILANTFAEVFQEHELSITRMRSKSLREFLQQQVNAKRQALEKAESELKNYMQSSGVVSLDAQASRVTQQLSTLEASRDGVDIEIESLTKTLATYQERLPEQEREAAKVIKQANDPYIRRIQEQLASLQVQRDVLMNTDLSAVGKEIYSQKLKEIEGQINNLQKKLDERTSSFLQTSPSGEIGSMQADPAGYLTQARQKIFETQMQIQALQSKKSALNNVIRQYESEFGQIPRKSIDLANLQRNRLSAEKLYLMVDEKFNEVSIVEKSEFANVGVVDKAAVPAVPVSPVLSINIMLGALIGLALGVGVVLMREYIDVRIHTPDDLKRKGYKVLSYASCAPTDGDPSAPPLVSIAEPFSAYAEAYRRLRTNLKIDEAAGRFKNILVTSPNPGEGKSTTACNLAIAFAHAERKVLLVDADIRKPTIHLNFRLQPMPGLTSLLGGTASLKEVVRRQVVPNLDIICAGSLEPRDVEILGRKNIRSFIEQSDQTYDVVILDSSPVLPVSDPLTLTSLADGTILVISANETRLATLERTVELLEGAGGKIAGVFLNNFDARRAYGGFYGSDRYGYYAGAYGVNGSTNGQRRLKDITANVAARISTYISQIKSHSGFQKHV